MKIRYPIIAIIALIITQIIIANLYPYPTWLDTASAIIFILIISCLGLIVYLILRNIIRAIKGAVTGVPQGDGYRDEARRACEKITPKKNKDVTPPWEG